MNATAQRAAAKIVELINSHPRRPTQQEIAAVLAKELAAAAEPGLSQRALADLARWDQAVREWQNPPDDEEVGFSDEELEGG
jgi:hypothetical protein